MEHSRFGKVRPIYQKDPVINFQHRFRSPIRFIYLVVFILVLGVMLTFLNLYELHKMREDHNLHHEMSSFAEGSHNDDKMGRPIVWIQGKNLHTGYLQHVVNVFRQTGYTIGDHSDDWTVLWAHDYPFKTLSKELTTLKPYQKVNHFPGSGFITSKVNLVASKLKYIPRAFKLPSEKERFLSFSKNHPDLMWVQKNNNHRGIQIKTASELNIKKEGSFIQQYIDNPFLIDGHKFDIGIYTILTSVNPLRVYIIEDDALFRFCPTEYYPFDPKDKDKYVVHDDYMPLWKISSLQDLYSKKGFNFKITFNQYMKSKDHNYKMLWADMVSAIQQVYQEKEHKLIEFVARYPSSHHFFELVRFDFVLDDKLNVYLMEANMSPNLSSRHFPPNKRLYEHVVFSLLSLVGLTQYVSNEQLDFEDDMRVAATDIRVFPELCASSLCTGSCSDIKCTLCRRCVTKPVEQMLKRAYLEHSRRGSTRRSYPPAINQTQAIQWDLSTEWPGSEELSDKNQQMLLWFAGKCRQDLSYCT